MAALEDSECWQADRCEFDPDCQFYAEVCHKYEHTRSEDD